MGLRRSIALSVLAGLRPGRRILPDLHWQPRPEGPLLWLHAASALDLEAALHLLQRLSVLDPMPSILLTLHEGLSLPSPPPKGVLVEAPPPDKRAQVQAFLDHFRPDLALICGRPLRPLLYWTMSKAGVPMTLVNVRGSDLDPPGFRLARNVDRAMGSCFQHIICRDGPSARRIDRLRPGLPPSLPLGRLEEGSTTPSANARVLETLRNQLAGRPLWLAAYTTPGEDPMVVEAHRQMGRYSHRLLCVIAPSEPERGGDLATILGNQGWRVALRSTGDTLSEDIQIVVIDTPDEMGLWFRLAPISFMGSSLIPGFGGKDPFAPATLGSAVLYGPNVGHYLDSYGRLVNAGGARIVKDASSLAQGLQLLLAPDKAAAQAHAAWDVASRGAEVTDKVLEILQEQLDEKVFS
ncbi:3-deoxy-D-manno-octulosonic acid transferase [Donghicola tyrosinivorans]|uniref:3-deoxy-D-manno-octulosonic acid transferase n=1 Tax=Donghicola tyrosinivorans TaxID=1652492 RepID=A0A2T0X4N4_9RHOB|nr:glycosyltransferase N-terminal domain-containing protein [Donghicola tyrosinivorans]PRY93899.1 3-deoxy-D-manno-octulosonic-acid transferase [Donghicola tyrosinivorans]